MPKQNSRPTTIGEEMTVSNTETTETPVEQQPQSDCSPVKEHASTGTTEDELAGQLNHMSLGSIHTSKRVMVDVDHSKVALIFWEATVSVADQFVHAQHSTNHLLFNRLLVAVSLMR